MARCDRGSRLSVPSTSPTHHLSSVRTCLLVIFRAITVLPDDTFAIQNTETCIIDWDATYSGPCKVTYTDGTVVERMLTQDTVIKLNNPNFVVEVENNLADRWVRGKLNRNKMIDGNCPVVEVCGTGSEPVIKNCAAGQEDTARNTYGVVTTWLLSVTWTCNDRLLMLLSALVSCASRIPKTRLLLATTSPTRSRKWSNLTCHPSPNQRSLQKDY